MQQHGNKDLSLHTPSAPGMASKGHIFFSESSHVAYQIKANGVKVHILSLHIHSAPRITSKC